MFFVNGVHGGTILVCAPKGQRHPPHPTPSQRHCYLSAVPLDTVADLCIQAGKQRWHTDAQRATKTAAMSGSNIKKSARKYQNNNSFYSASEDQINKFLSQQIKMNIVIGAVLFERAIYSARYMWNDTQFGRVVIWNGTNELLSAEVTSVDGDVMSRHYLLLFIHCLSPQESSDVVLQGSVFKVKLCQQIFLLASNMCFLSV